MEQLKKYSIAAMHESKVNLNKLNDEIESAGVVAGFTNIVELKKTNEIAVFGVAFDESALDALVAAHRYENIEELKERRYDEIDSRTVEIISAGFVFDGKTFSLSTQAQNNWTNIHSNKDVFNAIGSFPMQISTKDSDIYELAFDDVVAFWSAGMVAVKTPYNVGGNLKKSIFDAGTIEQVNLIIDNR